MSADSVNYKETILLPKTEFPMKADLVKREPLRLQAWESSGLYQQIRQARQGAKKFILHDGPPFANGDVHMGTALNKILKDLVVKSRNMLGEDAPFIPGWDCHGLPIEFKVVKSDKGLTPLEVRERSEAYARSFIDIQRNSFKRLGVLADWDNPYLTLDPAYEADILRTFAGFVERNLVYQSRRPVLWSYGAQTALAEAEVEYKDKTSPSIFVSFKATDGPVAELQGEYVIWTTTPWTIPANLGLAVHPKFPYHLAEFSHESGEKRRFLLHPDLIESFENATEWTRTETPVFATWTGAELAGFHGQHPFFERVSKVIPADFVTAESGTGIVHVAPGHGSDDYQAGRTHGLDLLSPVDDQGRYTEEVGLPHLVGKHVFDSNEDVIQLLKERSALLGRANYQHQYPHCWRSKTPIIFRAVKQFFIKIDDIRPEALQEIDSVQWLPHWGRNRIYGTVESRPDWCISRQRTWGVPVPAFISPDDEVILEPHLIRQVADLVAEHGSNLWFAEDDATWAARLGLPEGTRRGKDTLDVWIDSGCSHVAVLDRHPELSRPADLYLEATDQHRGWFQSSLMVSVAHCGKAPYKAVLTHGFVTDTSGEKISKSGDKPINAEFFYNKYGADLVRLWAASVDFLNEVPFSEKLFEQFTEPYRRLRNTLRILLANLHDFRSEEHAVPAAQLTLLDRWILERLNVVIQECREAYERFEFRKVFTTLNQFCTNELSALYIDVTKDRLYCDAANSPRRRATQTTMHILAGHLARLLAPIISFPADEAWEHLGHQKSVHLELFPEVDPQFVGTEATQVIEHWQRIRDLVQVEVEKARKEKTIGSNLEATVQLVLSSADPAKEILNQTLAELTEFLMLSALSLSFSDQPQASLTRTIHAKCPRCWRHTPDLGKNPDHPALCTRCAEAVVTPCTLS